MAILSFIVQLLGATMLLLYSVRMVRTGIARAFGASFKRIVTTSDAPLRAATTGILLAVVLQSSAAVGVLVAGFAGAGTLQFGTGLAVVLGADLGSALLIQVLSFDLEWLVPVLLAIGGSLFIKSDRRKLKQAGRIVLGIAFILISLRFLRETMDPIRDSAFLPAIAGYLARDFVTGFLAGAALALLMHSSVAVILMCVTLVAIEAVPLSAGISLVLGANLGSAAIPIWLTRGGVPAARRLPWANFVIRGAGAVLALMLVNALPGRFHPVEFSYLAPLPEAQILVLAHVGFNLVLLLFLPFRRVFRAPFERFIPDNANSEIGTAIEHKSVLSHALLETPKSALINLKREVMRMLRLVEGMAEPVMKIYETGDEMHAREIAAQDEHVNKALDQIRAYVSAMRTDRMTRDENRVARELTEYAIALERAGDIIAQDLVPRAIQKSKEGAVFSKEGKEELLTMHDRLTANMGLAANVLISDDPDSARELLEEKNEMSRMERDSRKKHLKRLGAGAVSSLGSSNIHLETLRSLRDLNSQISAIAYPILSERGLLLDSRLVSQPGAVTG